MHIVIIEDDEIFASKISKKLERNLYTTKVFNNANTFYKFKSNLETDLYIVDLNLTDDTWFNVIKHIRNIEKEYTPIIIMSWYSDVENKVYWLDLWADDYIQKPVVPDELLARIRSALRRHNTQINSSIIEYENIVFDLKTKKIFLSWVELRLPKKENQILEFFLQNKGKLITREIIMKKIWGIDDYFYITENTINATISKLRKKLWEKFFLKTRVNEWYILE